MPQCSYHPDIETEVSCAECGRAICPKEMKLTPVGYKCPDCARPKRGQYQYVKPKQALFGALAGLGAAFFGAWVLSGVGIGFLPLAFILGMLVGEAVRRASGGHRGGTVGAIAAVCVVLGGLAGGLDLLATALAVAGALSVLSWSFGK